MLILRHPPVNHEEVSHLETALPKTLTALKLVDPFPLDGQIVIWDRIFALVHRHPPPSGEGQIRLIAKRGIWFVPDRVYLASAAKP
jgi:hypothetical protein